MNFSTLLSCDELSRHLNRPDWRVFDCRHSLSDVESGEKAYAEGHVPGAFFLHLDRDLSGPMNGRNGRHPLPDPCCLASTLGATGVARDTQVVAYDDAGGMIAGRLWWLLRWLGHDRVALLDGGINQWMKEGRELSTELTQSVPCVFDIARRDWVVSTESVLANINKEGFCLIDARSPDRFRGENETLDPVGGHIPGARNRFFRDNLDDKGCFRPAAELRRDFLELLAGVEADKAVMQCGSGVTACHNLLAMEIAGLHGARLYAGSWSEWCADPARPVER
ncbi:MAG: sulfurtransferase [Propionivibrio sp.]|nr:sulfurtransferase [Propionivibrio sp.]